MVLAAALLFTLFPGLDLAISGLFYDPEMGFFLKDSPIVIVVYRGTPFLLAFSVILAIVSLVRRYERDGLARAFRPFIFILFVYLLGPGLLINGVLKDHWDRARPRQVAEFGGTASFTPALLPSDQCERNCSFASGHASVGFALMAFAEVFPGFRPFWMGAGIVMGSVIGFVRVVQGGHFPSDVVFSGLIVWFTIRSLRWILRDLHRTRGPDDG